MNVNEAFKRWEVNGELTEGLSECQNDRSKRFLLRISLFLLRFCRKQAREFVVFLAIQRNT